MYDTDSSDEYWIEVYSSYGHDNTLNRGKLRMLAGLAPFPEENTW